MMEGLLTPVSTSYTNASKDTAPVLTEVSKPREQVHRPVSQATTPEEALGVLKNEPDYEGLIFTLQFLYKNDTNFSISSPSPIASQLIHVLVTETVPNYWDVLQTSPQRKSFKTVKPKSDLQLLVSCLRNVPGLSAILLSLKQRIQQSKDVKKAPGGPSIQDILKILLQVLQSTLEGPETVETIWQETFGSSEASSKQNALWQEFVALLAGGKLLGISAEAEDVMNGLTEEIGDKHWVSDGRLYSLWLARNISRWANSLPLDSEIGFKSCSNLLSKSFRLGHTEPIIKILVQTMILQKDEHSQFTKLISILPSFEQRNLMFSLFKIISTDYLSLPHITEDNASWWQADTSNISAASALIKLVIANEESRKSQVISWLTSSSGAGIGDGVAIRRAVVVSLSTEKTDVETVLDKSLQQFGDQLYIRHTPTLQQEVHAQVLLLSAGYLHRQAPLRLSMMIRSGGHLSVVSNRLASSSPRARFLGMIVGEALSSLVDKGDKKMDFKMQEMQTREAMWYKSLVSVTDTVGTLDPLRQGAASQAKKSHPRTSKPTPKAMPAPTGSKIIAIEEVETDEEEEVDPDNDGLTPYAKPDSDVEDSDEDATLVTRNKPTAPVYIRDLITYLRDTENYDRQKLGLMTAAPLIRRKANFGTEVSAHAEELATLLVGIQDKYDIENFMEMRQQGMIAILIALPQKMGQWFAKTFFDGDYSLSQRASVLTTLGLGARELGGFGAEDSAIPSTKKNSPASFPSKTLPAAMHSLYTTSNTTKPLLKATPRSSNRTGAQHPKNAISFLSSALSNTMIAPLASSASKTLNGPALLQTRTFSTRPAVAAARSKPTTNTLAQIVSTSFFFPLTGRFSLLLSSARISSFPALTSPYLLSHLLKTLALLLHASGPNTLALPQMTAEFWSLLLALRVRSQGDISVMEGLLFAFLTILEVNEDKRRLVQEQGRQLLETQEWVESVFSRLGTAGGSGIQGLMGGGGQALSEEDEKVRMLAAAVLVRIRECVEKYQALLMGDLASF